MTTEANQEESTLSEVVTTARNNLLESSTTIDPDEANSITLVPLSNDLFTTESSVDAASTILSLENDNLLTTTEISNEIIHRDGEIIGNVMMIYPNEMSGKPKVKPDQMGNDANEIRIHDDTMGTDLHIIYPLSETVAIANAESTEAFHLDKSTIKTIDELTTQLATDAPSTTENLTALVMQSNESNTSTINNTEKPTSSTESPFDLTSEATEMANRIENVTAKKPRYKRRKLKRKSLANQTSTTTIAPMAAPTPIPAYKLRSRYRDTFSRTVIEPRPLVTSNHSTTNVESNTRKTFTPHIELLKSRENSVAQRNDSIAFVANEHLLKISALREILTTALNANTTVQNITDFLAQRGANGLPGNSKRKILNLQRINRSKNLNISTGSTTTFEAATPIEIETTTIPSIKVKTTTDVDDPGSTTLTSLRRHFRYDRRRVPVQRINRIKNSNIVPATTMTTNASPRHITSKLNGTRGILRRRNPTKRTSLIPSLQSIGSVVTAESEKTSNVRKRTKGDRMNASKRNTMETLRRKKPTITTKPTTYKLMHTLQRKRTTSITSTTTESITKKSPTRRFRRRKTKTTTTTHEPISIVSAKLSERSQSIDAKLVEPIEITSSKTTPISTTTIISAAPYFETSTQPIIIASTNKLNDFIVNPTQSSRTYIEVTRPSAPATFPANEEMAQINLQPMKSETIPDVIEPINREPSTTKKLNPVNQIGQSSSQSETFVRPTGALLPTYRQPAILSSISPIQSAAPISHRYYIDRNHRLTTKYNAGQFLQQRPIYAGETTPSNFGGFNVQINYH